MKFRSLYLDRIIIVGKAEISLKPVKLCFIHHLEFTSENQSKFPFAIDVKFDFWDISPVGL